MVKFKNIRIRTKLILIQGATALTAIVICSVIFVLNAISTFKESAVNNKYSLAQVVGDNAASSLLFKDQDAAKRLLSILTSNESILNTELLDREGKYFIGVNSKGEEGYHFPALKQQKQLGYTELGDGK